MRTPACLVAILMITSAGCPSADWPDRLDLGTELEQGVVYLGGETVKDSGYGISFTVPDGWTGAAEGEKFILEHDGDGGLIAMAAREATLSDEIGRLASEGSEIVDGISMSRSFSGSVTGDFASIDLSYNLESEEPFLQPMNGRGIIVGGRYGVAVTSLGFGPFLDPEPLEQALVDLSESLQFFAPDFPATQ